MKRRKASAIAAALGGVAALGAGADPAAAMLPAEGGGPPPAAKDGPPDTPVKRDRANSGQTVPADDTVKPPPGVQAKVPPGVDTGEPRPDLSRRPVKTEPMSVASSRNKPRPPGPGQTEERVVRTPASDREEPGRQMTGHPTNAGQPANTGRPAKTEGPDVDPEPGPREQRRQLRSDTRGYVDALDQIEQQGGAMSMGTANAMERYGSNPRVPRRASRVIERRERIEDEADTYANALDRIDDQGGALSLGTATIINRHGGDSAVVRRAREIRRQREELEKAQRLEAGSIERVEDTSDHGLVEHGFNTKTNGDADDLGRTNEVVGMKGVLNDLNRQTQDLDHDDEPVKDVDGVDGYSFDDADNDVDYLHPQGLTETNGVQIVSWYGKPGGDAPEDEDGDPIETGRITIVGRDQESYRHVLLVTPKGGSEFDQVPTHAGGVAQAGRYLYVADTTNGVRVFDTRKIMRTDAREEYPVEGYRYILPEVGSYQTTRPGTRFSTLSLDDSDPDNPALVVAEYRDDDKPKIAGDSHIMRWTVDPKAGRLAQEEASDVFVTKKDQLQGAAMNNGKIFATSSNPDRVTGVLYSGYPGQQFGGEGNEKPWGDGNESLYVDGRWMWSVTEHEGKRAVFKAPLDNY